MSDIVAQMHYHRTGKLETDSSQIGLWIEQNTKTRQMQRPDKDKCKEKTEWQRTEIQSSEFRGDRVLGRLGRLKAIREQYENR